MSMRVGIWRVFVLISILSLVEHLRELIKYSLIIINANETNESRLAMSTYEAAIDKHALVVENTDALNSNSSKSYFILHVGPPKTATTTLQSELNSFRHSLLEQDNVLYIMPSERHPPLIAALHDPNCHKILRRVRHEQEDRNATQDELRQALSTNVDCWKPFVTEIERYRQVHNNDISIMYSKEVFGIRHWPPTDWTSLQETLASLDMELVVVITYRRYYEWMLSSKLHAEKWTGVKPKHLMWPKHQGRRGGLRIEPFIPIHGRPHAFYYPFRYTDDMLSMIGPHVPQTKVLNLHDNNQSITTSLLCNVLTNTKQTCKSSLEKDASLVEHVRANTQESYRDASQGEMQTITFYDLIATTAADMAFVNTTLISRREAGLECQRFHQHVLNETLHDLPLQCPSQQYLETFLNQSLAKEKDIVPDFYRAHKDEHRASFWKAAGDNKFCMVNATAVLTNQRWKDFVSSLGRVESSK